MNGTDPTSSFSPLDSNQRILTSLPSSETVINLGITDFRHLSAPPAGGVTGASNGNMETANWKSLFPKEKESSVDPAASKLFHHKPQLVNGKSFIPASDFEEEIRVCEKMLIGYFVGSRLSFHIVEKAMKEIWKLKGGFRLTINGDSIFLFEFDLAEDRITAIEQGSVFISSRLFLIRPWHLFVEQDIQEMKTFPIWLNLKNIPIHLWNAKGISMITSVLGIPLLTDKNTLARTRMSFARVCIEIEADFNYPATIPMSFGGKEFEVQVEYSWKPPRCLACAFFGHSSGKCSKDSTHKIVKKKLAPKKTNEDKEKEKFLNSGKGGSNNGEVVEDMIVAPEYTPKITSEVAVILNEQISVVQIMNENGYGNEGVLEMVSSPSSKWYTRRPKSASKKGEVPVKTAIGYMNPFSILDSEHESENEMEGVDNLEAAVNAQVPVSNFNECDDSEYETDYEEMDMEKLGTSEEGAVKGKLKLIKDIPPKSPLSKDNHMDRLLKMSAALGASERGNPVETKKLLNDIVKDYNNISVSRAEKEQAKIFWPGVSCNEKLGEGREPLPKN